MFKVSFFLSVPNLTTYDVEKQLYITEQKEKNLTFYRHEIIEECVQMQNSFWATFTQWYSTVVSYLIPLTVLIVCYVKILMYLAKQNKKMAKKVSQFSSHFFHVLGSISRNITELFYDAIMILSCLAFQGNENSSIYFHFWKITVL